MIPLRLFLLVLALVLLLLAGCGVTARRVQLGWLGLFLWLLETVLR